LLDGVRTDSLLLGWIMYLDYVYKSDGLKASDELR
jgi:hypothetical protein